MLFKSILEQIYQNVIRIEIKVININIILVENLLTYVLSNSSLYFVAVLFKTNNYSVRLLPDKLCFFSLRYGC